MSAPAIDGSWLAAPGLAKRPCRRCSRGCVRPWVEPVIGALPEREARVARRVCETIATRSQELQVDKAPRWFPIRIDLPSLARWLASAGEEATLADWLTLEVLRMVDAAQVVDGVAGRAMMQRADLFWIFDGLDEVPATANREALVRMVRDALATTRGHAVVTTRPQSYAGELTSGCSTCVAGALVASAYAERLVEGDAPRSRRRRRAPRPVAQRTGAARARRPSGHAAPHVGDGGALRGERRAASHLALAPARSLRVAHLRARASQARRYWDALRR